MSFETEKKGLAGIIAASSVGTLIEWYDFYIFGYKTTLIGRIPEAAYVLQFEYSK